MNVAQSSGGARRAPGTGGGSLNPRRSRAKKSNGSFTFLKEKVVLNPIHKTDGTATSVSNGRNCTHGEGNLLILGQLHGFGNVNCERRAIDHTLRWKMLFIDLFADKYDDSPIPELKIGKKPRNIAYF